MIKYFISLSLFALLSAVNAQTVSPYNPPMVVPIGGGSSGSVTGVVAGANISVSGATVSVDSSSVFTLGNANNQFTGATNMLHISDKGGATFGFIYDDLAGAESPVVSYNQTSGKFNFLYGIEGDISGASGIVYSNISRTSLAIPGSPVTYRRPRNINLVQPFANRSLYNESYVSNLVVSYNRPLYPMWDIISIDEGWANPTRRTDGHLAWITNNWPSGIPWLANFCKTNGYELWLARTAGIANDIGNDPGATGHEAEDAADLHSWGISGAQVSDDTVANTNPLWLKTDGSGVNGLYEQMLGAYAKRLAPFNTFLTVHTNETWMPDSVYAVWPQPSNDYPGVPVAGLDDNSAGLTNTFIRWSYCEQFLKTIRPGSYYVSPFGQTPIASSGISSNNFHWLFALNCLIAAPTLQGGPWQSAESSTIATNADYYSLQQSPRISSPRVLGRSTDVRIIVAPFADGSVGLGLLNTNLDQTLAPRTNTITLAELGITASSVYVRDCKRNTNLGSFSSLTLSVLPSQLEVYRLTPTTVINGNLTVNGNITGPVNASNIVGTITNNFNSPTGTLGTLIVSNIIWSVAPQPTNAAGFVSIQLGVPMSRTNDYIAPKIIITNINFLSTSPGAIQWAEARFRNTSGGNQIVSNMLPEVKLSGPLSTQANTNGMIVGNLETAVVDAQGIFGVSTNWSCYIIHTNN